MFKTNRLMSRCEAFIHWCHLNLQEIVNATIAVIGIVAVIVLAVLAGVAYEHVKTLHSQANRAYDVARQSNLLYRADYIGHLGWTSAIVDLVLCAFLIAWAMVDDFE